MSTALTVKEAFKESHPFHQMMADALEELGGLNFIVDWAEENQGEFIKLLMLLAPPPQPEGTGKAKAGDNVLNLSLHPSLAPGPLDQGKVVSDQ